MMKNCTSSEGTSIGTMNRTVGMRDALRARQTGDRTFVVIAISDERDEHIVYQTHDMVGEDASNVPYITLTAIVRSLIHTPTAQIDDGEDNAKKAIATMRV